MKQLESKSIFIIREAYKKFKKPTILWSGGKDSTMLLWLCKEAFYGNIPFKVIYIDTGLQFSEIHKFRDKYAKDWKLDIIIAKNESKVKPDKGIFECCNSRKTEALKQVVKEHKIDALLVGIRRDEHGIRNKERYFSPRDKDFNWNVAKKKSGGDSPFESVQDSEFDGWNIFATDFGYDTNHVRVHPILHWTELEIWKYIKEKGIPQPSLYFANKGKRYRSIGCECCCKPVDSEADDIDKIIGELKKTTVQERSGRDQDKEDQMQRLRSLGYM